MDESQKEQVENEESSESSRTRVGFPQQQPEKKSSKKGLILVVVLLLLLLAGGAWYLFSGKESMTAEDATSTPTEEEATSTPTPTTVKINREGIKIQVLNGTGIPGAAGDLQKELESLGYTDIKVGNASGQNAVKTTVVFDPDVQEDVMNDITEKLDKIYEDVTTTEKSQTAFDIVITTGYPVGYKASPTPSPKANLTPTRSASPSASPTATKTPTPTP